MRDPAHTQALLTATQQQYARASAAAPGTGSLVLDKVATVSRDLHYAIAMLAAIRTAIADVAHGYDEAVRCGAECASCHDAKLRQALSRLQRLVHEL